MNTCNHISHINPANHLEVNPVRILSIDAGGVRGIISAKLIAEVEKRTHRLASELFDIIAGTSSGSFIGGGLTHNYTGERIVQLWDSQSRRMLPYSCIRAAVTLAGLIAPKYDADSMEEVLNEHFGDALLSDSSTELICPSFETTVGENRYFSRDAAKDHFNGVKIADVVRASSAAQGYFRSKQITIEDQKLNFVDGGTFAPNPSYLAYSSAGDPEHAFVVSLGAGRYVKPLTYYQTAKMGFLGWVTEGEITNIYEQSNIQHIHEMMEKNLGDKKYFRLQANLDRAVSLDAVDEIPYLVEKTNEYIGANDHKIDQICADLTAVSPH
jgi:predicted acylesterase/phospholipase RssA